ncbi:MAG: hypothetical protein VB051_12485 [Candidatus Pelethousia sp.]|nr:hypothetical protein [Candidatus Pelethousia sp.]
MTKDAYPALFHFIHKNMAEIEFPSTKQHILDVAGERPISVDWNQTVPLKRFVEPIELESFSSAADFYCAMIAFF